LFDFCKVRLRSRAAARPELARWLAVDCLITATLAIVPKRMVLALFWCVPIGRAGGHPKKVATQGRGDCLTKNSQLDFGGVSGRWLKEWHRTMPVPMRFRGGGRNPSRSIFSSIL